MRNFLVVCKKGGTETFRSGAAHSKISGFRSEDVQVQA